MRAADPFAAFLGIELVEVGPGFARARMAVTAEMVNAHGTTHGGAIFSLADAAFAAASNSHGVPAVALDMHISYLRKSAPGDVLVATAREENLTRRTGLYRIVVENQRQEAVAIAAGLVYRLAGEKGPREAAPR
ncbi:hydroxyphenylacetyl-CoA thioesterase PaaI [Desulfovirgula thermocuniculi]|uniref:hydroxyphenylacetyl-CoA thioesterase PaaI n=1 Tax=Desulfovirgula thermocuniculi TaxID=348842 RepID=UPI00040AAF17|nr:hydroxyphenylacetyl-CoA thioesterase PaaI [Desulfovirgula thermocuniculi]